MVCAKCGRQIGLMYANGHTHQHVLWSLHNLVVDAQQIAAKQCLGTKVTVLVVAAVVNLLGDGLFVLLHNVVHIISNEWRVFPCVWVDVVVQDLDDRGKVLLGLLVQVGDGDATGKYLVVGVDGRLTKARGEEKEEAPQHTRTHTRLAQAMVAIVLRHCHTAGHHWNTKETKRTGLGAKNEGRGLEETPDVQDPRKRKEDDNNTHTMYAAVSPARASSSAVCTPS
jgi:hypothetical protein